MADTKISALTDGTTANAADDIPINRAGTNYRITPAYIQTYIKNNQVVGEQVFRAIYFGAM